MEPPSKGTSTVRLGPAARQIQYGRATLALWASVAIFRQREHRNGPNSLPSISPRASWHHFLSRTTSVSHLVDLLRNPIPILWATVVFSDLPGAGFDAHVCECAHEHEGSPRRRGELILPLFKWPGTDKAICTVSQLAERCCRKATHSPFSNSTPTKPRPLDARSETASAGDARPSALHPRLAPLASHLSGRSTFGAQTLAFPSRWGARDSTLR